MLRREPRAIARSLLTRRTVPGRGKLGFKYLIHPGDPGVLPLPRWTSYSDYQLCFWYALEMERRQRVYGELVTAKGCAIADATAEELHDADRFLAVADVLSLLPADADRAALRAAHARIAGVTHNPNAGSVAIADPTAMEDAVWTAVDDADLRAWVESRHR